MLEEEKFKFDIDNIKTDLAIEDIVVTDNDVALLRRYFNKEISMNDMIETIKNEI